MFASVFMESERKKQHSDAVSCTLYHTHGSRKMLKAREKKQKPANPFRREEKTKELSPLYGFSEKTLTEQIDKAFDAIKRSNPAQTRLF